MAHQQGCGTSVCLTLCMAVCAGGRAGRALKPCQLDQGAMVSTWQKAMAPLSSASITTDTASQTELWWEHGGTQVSGCRVCPALMPVSDGSSGHTCGRCAQVEEQLCLVAELREEVSRLRSTRESERETDYWNRTLPSLGQAQQADCHRRLSSEGNRRPNVQTRPTS